MEDFQKIIISKFLDSLENDVMKQFGIELFNSLPDYWYKVAASSSGKYHRHDVCGDYGLFIHSWRVEEFITYMLELEQYSTKFTSMEKDALRLSAFIHDGEKHGKDDIGGHTIFEHPQVMSETIRCFKTDKVDQEILDFMADAIKSHMGQWNTTKKSKIELPKPTTLAQELVHLADYLASRKPVSIDVPENCPKQELPKPEEYMLTFGKHNGELLSDVIKNDYSYITWLKESYHKEPLRTMVEKL